MATANERLLITIEADLKVQQALRDFVTQAQAAFKQVQASAQQMNQSLATAVSPLKNFTVVTRQATQNLNTFAETGHRAGRTLTAVFQNAILGFQVFSVGLKNIGSQGFNQIAKGAQDLTRNVFRSFRGITTEGNSVFGQLASLIGSSLEGIVTLTGNVASNVIKGFAAIPKAIGGVFGGLAQTVGGALLFFPSQVVKIVGLFTAGFGSIAKVITDSIGGALSAVGQIVENVSRLVSGVLRGITTVAREVADKVVAVFEGIVGAVGQAFGVIADVALKTFGAVGLAGAGAATLILRDFSIFEVGLRRTFGAVGATTGEARAELTAFANDLRTTFGRGAGEVTGGLFLATTSGADSTTEALGNLTEAMRLTEAFGGDLNTTLLTVSRVLEVYRGEVQGAAEVSDLLAGVVIEGQAEFAELAQSLGNVTATAAAAGIPLRELLATLSTLTQRLPTDVAVTSLTRFIETLVAAQPEADAFRRKIGIAFTELPATIKAQIEGFEEARDAIRAQADELEAAGVSTKSATDAMKALDDEIENVTRRNREFGGLTNAVKQFFEAVKDGRATAGDIRQLFPEARERRAILQLGSDQGILSLEQSNRFFEDTTGLVDRQLLEVQDSLDSNFRRMVQSALVAGNEIAAAFGPVVVGALEEFRVLLEERAEDLRTFFQSASFTEFRDKLTESVRGFIREIPAAVTAVREFIEGAIERFNSFRETVTPIFEAVTEKVRDLFRAFSAGPEFGTVFKGLLDGDFTPLKDKFSAVFNELRLDPLIAALESAGKRLGAAVLDGLADLAKTLAPILDPILDKIKSTFESIRDIIAGIKLPDLGNVTARGVASGAVGAVPGIAFGAIEGLGNAILGTAELTGNLVIGTLEGAADVFNSVVERGLRDLGGDEPADNFRKVFRPGAGPSESQTAALTAEGRKFAEAMNIVSEALGGVTEDAAPVAFTIDGLSGTFRSMAEAVRASDAAQSERVAAEAALQEALDQQRALAARGFEALGRAVEFMREKVGEAQALLLKQTQDYVAGLIEAAGGLEGIAQSVGASIGRLLTTGSPQVIQGPATKPPAPELSSDEKEALRRAQELAERGLREARENAQKIAQEIQVAKDAIVDSNLEAAELVRDRIESLRDVASQDIGQLATLGRRQTSVTLQGIREASEQKRLAQGTLKGIDVLAKVFADLGPRESAVFDENTLSTSLGVAVKDVIPTLVDAFRVLFDREPRGGALGRAATGQAENFLNSRDARTALKLLAKDGDDAAAAFRGFAESKGGVGEFTTKLFESAQTAAFTTGNFTALNKITTELTEKFGDVATGLKAFGAGGGGGGADSNQAVADGAKALQDVAKEVGGGFKFNKGFLNTFERLAEKRDPDAITAEIFKRTGGVEKENLPEREKANVEALAKLRDAITGRADTQINKIDSLGSIESPVKVVSEEAGLLIEFGSIALKAVQDIKKAIEDSTAEIQITLADGFGTVSESIANMASDLTRELKNIASILLSFVDGTAGGKGPGAPARLGIQQRSAAGGIFTARAIREIGEEGPEAVIPLGRLSQIITQFVKPAITVDQNSLRAELPQRPTARGSNPIPTSLGVVGTRLDSASRESASTSNEMAALSSIVERALGRFAEAQGAARREMVALENRIGRRVGSVEKVINQEIGKNRRYNSASLGLRIQGTPAV